MGRLCFLAICLLSVCQATTTTGQSAVEKLDIADRELDELTRRLASLSQRLETTLGQAKSVDFYAVSEAKRLDEFEGKRGPCKKRFFPCGPGPDDGVQCVRDYLVCDNYKDCKNGADEAPYVCKLPVDKPISLDGILIRDDCKTLLGGRLLSGENVTWSLKAINIIPWFPSRPQIEYTFTFGEMPRGSQNKGHLKALASFDYSTGNVWIPWEPPHGMVGPCKFDATSPEKLSFTCELENYDDALNDEKQTCYAIKWGN